MFYYDSIEIFNQSYTKDLDDSTRLLDLYDSVNNYSMRWK